MLNGLGICSGIGGLERALDPWVKWVACCERERYPAGVLLGNTGTPIWDDLETFPWDDFKGKIDIVAAGFPCQDVSTAGFKSGMDGKRSVLVFKIIEGCRRMGCDTIFLENVPNVTALMGGAILNCLTYYGYDARWLTLRVPIKSKIKEGERFFLLASSFGCGAQRGKRFGESLHSDEQAKIRHRWKIDSSYFEAASKINWRDPFGESGSFGMLRRVPHGIPNWAHRIKALGNAVVSEQAQEAFKILTGF